MESIRFNVTGLAASVDEGVPVEWEGRSYNSGRLEIEMDPGPTRPSVGVLDYAARRARVEFHVRLRFPEFAAKLVELGVSPSLAAPVRAVLTSEGAILEDHSFQLAGHCQLGSHPLFGSQTRAEVLTGT